MFRHLASASDFNGTYLFPSFMLYLILSKHFASKKFFVLLWLVILLGLSGFTYMSAGGSFASLNFESRDSYADWPNSVYIRSYFLVYNSQFIYLLSSKLGLCVISLLIPQTFFFYVFRWKFTILLWISNQ